MVDRHNSVDIQGVLAMKAFARSLALAGLVTVGSLGFGASKADAQVFGPGYGPGLSINIGSGYGGYWGCEGGPPVVGAGLWAGPLDKHGRGLWCLGGLGGIPCSRPSAPGRGGPGPGRGAPPIYGGYYGRGYYGPYRPYGGYYGGGGYYG